MTEDDVKLLQKKIEAWGELHSIASRLLLAIEHLKDISVIERAEGGELIFGTWRGDVLVRIPLEKCGFTFADLKPLLLPKLVEARDRLLAEAEKL